MSAITSPEVMAPFKNLRRQNTSSPESRPRSPYPVSQQSHSVDTPEIRALEDKPNTITKLQPADDAWSAQTLENDDENQGRHKDEIMFRFRLMEKDEPDHIFYQNQPFKVRNHVEPISELNGIEYWEDVSVMKKKIRSNPNSKIPSSETRAEARQRREEKRHIDIDGNWDIIRQRNAVICINNWKCQEALRRICDYYPSQSLLGTIWIHYPFKILWHYYDELTDPNISKEPHSEEKSLEPTEDAEDAEKGKPVQVMIDEMFRMIETKKEKWNDIQAERMRQKSGLATYKHLWLLFKPGQPVYATVDNRSTRFVVVESRYFFDHEIKEKRYAALQITVWYLRYCQGRLRRQKRVFEIREFAGSMRIEMLAVFPCENQPDANVVQDELTRNGKKYWDILRNGPRYMKFDGITLSKTTKKFQGFVVVDPIGYYSTTHHTKVSAAPNTAFRISIEGGSEDMYHPWFPPPDKDYQSRWLDLDDVDPMKEAPKDLQEDYYSLFPRDIMAFALGHKEWVVLDIEYLEDVQWESEPSDIEKRLVLPPEDIGIILSMLKRQEGKEGETFPNPQLDDVDGKGEECVADYLRRPLIHLTAADLGIDNSGMEALLVEWFKHAERWSAVILLDEADVFFERRAMASTEKNAMVSGRSMGIMVEYNSVNVCQYSFGQWNTSRVYFLWFVVPSIMALWLCQLTFKKTTNQVGKIDEAIASRIQIPIYYAMDASSCKRVWNKYLARIPDFFVSRSTRDWIMEDVNDDFRPDGQAHVGKSNEGDPRQAFWNGREIRHALNTAKALAIREKHRPGNKDTIEIETKHFQAAKERRKAFYNYLERVRGVSHSAAAHGDGIRLDEAHV
ncbi:putative p-loop containing nucleoside triphosphate hydrolase protein [Seiridium unicorne]|uniref:P-loop containing nucleoside triphosphate hydrolase protein n=1 Tax=Seiridium unicorne TaxID=138068 RepID=A0ABR2UTR0_9PEZI